MNTNPSVTNGDIDSNATTRASSIAGRHPIVPPEHKRTSGQLATRKSPDNDNHVGHSTPSGTTMATGGDTITGGFGSGL